MNQKDIAALKEDTKHGFGWWRGDTIQDIIKYFESRLAEATAAANRFMDNVVQLQREKKELEKRLQSGEQLMAEGIEIFDKHQEEIWRLKRELDEVHEARKVTVPEEVADAFDSLKSKLVDKETIGWCLFNIIVCRDSTLDVQAKVIKRHFGLNYYDLAAALINGYTIEPTREEQLLSILEQGGKPAEVAARIDELYKAKSTT